MTDYYELLARLQKLLQPRTYVEIGFRQGQSFALAKTAVHSVAIDPSPDVQILLPAGAKLFKLTSDEFFTSHNLRATGGSLPTTTLTTICWLAPFPSLKAIPARRFFILNTYLSIFSRPGCACPSWF